MTAPPTARRRCDRSHQLREHTPLVRKIAGRIGAKAPANVGMDELMQAGMIGLNEAMSRFENNQGASFDTYASRRIEGAMLDTLRAADALTREARQRQREIRAAVHGLQHRLLRAPRAQEVAEELGWTLAELHDRMVEAGAAAMRHDDQDVLHAAPDSHSADPAMTVIDEHADPLHALERRRRHVALGEAVEALDERERAVMEMIYEHGLDQGDVASTLGLSAARMSQIHAGIVAKLKRRLRDW